MSSVPAGYATIVDLFGTGDVAGLGTTTGTAAYRAHLFPPGKKAVQISFVTSATATINLQNSLDRTTYFNVLIATNTSVIAEVDSMVPYWRINVTSHSTSGTGSGAAMVARMAQVL